MITRSANSAATAHLDSTSEALVQQALARAMRGRTSVVIAHVAGGTKTIRTDVRFICATNKELRQAVKEGKFREDLFFRINVMQIHLPPLKERDGDAVELATEHVARALSRGALDRDQIHAELRNVHAALLADAPLAIEDQEVEVALRELLADGQSGLPAADDDGIESLHAP